MGKILFCKKCLYSTLHPFSLVINENGICSGCLNFIEKYEIVWPEKLYNLKKITDHYKTIRNNTYDCIVPISGGDESFFTLHVVKNVLKLNPLLVYNNKYFNTPIGIHNLSRLRTIFDADVLIQNVNINTVKKITRNTLINLGSMYWPVIAGQTVFPVKMAIKYKIPLIIWGGHQGNEQVGMFSHNEAVEMTRRYRKEHDLMGFEAEDLISIFNDLKEEDVINYIYPDDSDINRVGVRGIYLSNYIFWDPIAQYNEMIRMYNFKKNKNNRTFNNYDHVDCYNYMGIHDCIKLFKQGYSKVTDHAVREIRHGRLTKKRALELVKQYEINQPQGINLFCDWLNIDNSSLNFIIRQFSNKKLFSGYKHSAYEYPLRNLLSYRINEEYNSNNVPDFFIKNYSDGLEKYIYYGKGI